jgi:hypothetical protein
MNKINNKDNNLFVKNENSQQSGNLNDSKNLLRTELGVQIPTGCAQCGTQETTSPGG